MFDCLLNLGKPILHLGPEESHVLDILNKTKGNISTRHDEIGKLVSELDAFSRLNAAETFRIGEEKIRPYLDQPHLVLIGLELHPL